MTQPFEFPDNGRDKPSRSCHARCHGDFASKINVFAPFWAGRDGVTGETRPAYAPPRAREACHAVTLAFHSINYLCVS